MEISVKVTGSGIEIGCVDGTNLPRTERGEKGKSIIAFPEKYCVVDLETTGISPAYNDIIEIGAIKYENGKEVDRLQTLMKPPLDPNGWYVDGFITALTGITNEMLADAPEPEEVLPIFRDFLGNDEYSDAAEPPVRCGESHLSGTDGATCNKVAESHVFTRAVTDLIRKPPAWKYPFQD